MRVTDQYVFFWNGDVFSNFHPCQFIVNGVKYVNSEQYFMAQKALFFEDKESYNKIMKEHNPHECKKIGRRVKNFNAELWDGASYAIMKEGVMAKFSQNPHLKQKMIFFQNQEFVEASPFDAIWGVKMGENDPNIENKEKWCGLNKLGQIMTEVRDFLKKELNMK